MDYIKNLPYHGSVKTKLIAAVIAIVLVFAVFISSTLLSQNKASYEQQTQHATRQVIQQLARNVDNYFGDLDRLITTICASNYLMDSLEIQPRATPYQKLEQRRGIERLLDDIMVIPREDIISVYILADEIYRGGRVAGSVDNTVAYDGFDWYNNAIQTGKPQYLPKHMEQLVTDPKYTVFSLVRRINTVRGLDKALGVIKVDANVRSLQKICADVDTGGSGALLIADAKGSVQYSSVVDSARLTAFANVLLPDESGTVAVDGDQYIYCRAEIERPGWFVIAFHSTEQLVKLTQTAALWVVLLTAGACLLLAVVLVLLLSTQFIKPLFVVTECMESVQCGNLSVRFPEERQDEIGYLGFAANRMLYEINSTMRLNEELNKEVYQTRLLQHKAELSALQSRIKPHFVHNTLNLISMQVQSGMMNEAVQNIHRLSFLMRAMAKSAQVIQIREELELLEAYLAIQKSRYQDRLDYLVDVSESTLKMCVPALLLQPIIENAIVHGCENNPNKTIIHVYDGITPEAVEVTIEDNALGISPEVLAALNKKLTDPSASIGDDAKSIGLINTHARMRLFFGTQYGIRIRSELGRGTRVVLLLPLQVLRKGGASCT